MKCAGGVLSHLTNIFQDYQDNTGAKFVILFAALRRQQPATCHYFLCVECHFKVFQDYSNSDFIVDCSLHVYLQINLLAPKDILFLESLQLNGVENKTCQKPLSDNHN